MTEPLSMVSRVYVMVVQFLVTYSFQLLGAVLIVVGGYLVSGMVARSVQAVITRRGVDIALGQLLVTAARIAVLAVFIVIALANLGISIAPLMAAVGGTAVGVGLALQGTLSNYGAGLSIILGRMFRVGDNIEVLKCAGIVTEITLAVTRLRTEDGEDIIIPNRKIVDEIHRNSYRQRIVENTVCVGHGEDPRKVVALIEGVLRGSVDVVGEHPPQVGIERFADAGMVIAYRYWVPNARYFDTRHAVNSAIHGSLTENGIALAPSTRGVATGVGGPPAH